MSETATVEVLTAEVRVLMVGSRQVTLSVARQLDDVSPDEIEPFGRIRLGRKPPSSVTEQIEVIGSADGILAVAHADFEKNYCSSNGTTDSWRRECKKHLAGGSHDGHWWFGWDFEDAAKAWRDLPLIVLAGLR